MKKLFFIATFYLLSGASYVLAQNSAIPTNNNSAIPTGNGTPGSGGSITIANPLGNGTTIAGLFEALLQILLIFAVPIVVFFIIYAGFLYVTARGNTEQVTKAHRALAYALIGGVLILGGAVLIEVVQSTVNAIRN